MMAKMRKVMKQFNAMSPIEKASFALIFAKFFQKGLGMISGPIFTRIMPQGEYGIISTFGSWQSVIFIVATLNMSSGVFNNGMIEFKKDRDTFVYSIMCLANLTTSILAVGYLLFYQQIKSFIGMSNILMFVIFLHCFFAPAYNYWMGRQRFEYKYKAITIVMMSIAILSTGVSIFAVVNASDLYKAVVKIIASESVLIIVGITLWIYTIWKVKGKINLSYWKYALRFNLPLIPHYLSMYVLDSSDRIMITTLSGTEDTAVYGVAYTIASIMLIFWNSVDSAYAPWIYQHMEENKIQPIKERGNQIIILFAGMSLVSILFAPEIMSILAPESYYMGIFVVPAVAIGVFFTAIYSLYMRIELFLKRTGVVMIATCVVAILNIGLNYFFIPQFGFVAAGYTTLTCYVLLALVHGMNLKRLGYSNVYDNKKVMVLSILMIVMSVVVMYIYQWTLVRYTLIIMLLGIIVWKRKKIILMLKRK